MTFSWCVWRHLNTHDRCLGWMYLWQFPVIKNRVGDIWIQWAYNVQLCVQYVYKMWRSYPWCCVYNWGPKLYQLCTVRTPVYSAYIFVQCSAYSLLMVRVHGTYHFVCMWLEVFPCSWWPPLCSPLTQLVAWFSIESASLANFGRSPNVTVFNLHATRATSRLTLYAIMFSQKSCLSETWTLYFSPSKTMFLDIFRFCILKVAICLVCESIPRGLLIPWSILLQRLQF